MVFESIGQTPEDFELRNEELYYKDMNVPLTTEKETLKSVREIAHILGKNRLHKLGFFVPDGKITA